VPRIDYKKVVKENCTCRGIADECMLDHTYHLKSCPIYKMLRRANLYPEVNR